MPRGLGARHAASGLLLALAACTPDMGTGTRGVDVREVRPTATVSSTPQLLYQQSPLPFTALLPVVSSLAADFTVPDGPNWVVSSITLVGNALDDALFVDLVRDAGGVPGNDVVLSQGGGAFGSVDPCCGGEVFDYEVFRSEALLFPLNLSPGTYWVVIRSFSAPFSPQASAVAGSPALVILQTGATTWVPWNLDGANVDIAFRVNGNLETLESAATSLSTALDELNLDAGLSKSLRAKLDLALAAIAAGKTVLACNLLQDFINQVSAQSGKKIAAAVAAALVSEANRIRALLGC